MISQKQILEAIGEQLTLFPVASRNHVSHSQPQANDKAQTMLDISGLRCLELFERSSLGTSWARMFVGLLIGQKGWYSTRCALTWKLKVMKSSRYYFQLHASTLRTKETESGLLLTPTINMLPTPTVRDFKSPKRVNSKTNYSMLNETIHNMMLPTPTQRDYKGARTSEGLEKSGRNQTNSLPDYFAQTGKTSQLSPQFVMEMMGFPTDWTELPFLSGAKNPSKEEEMP